MNRINKIVFDDMTQDEIDMYESKTDSIVMFDDRRGICFQKAKKGGLVIMIDGAQKNIILSDRQFELLRLFFESPF
jgi:hypothetical protein